MGGASGALPMELVATEPWMVPERSTPTLLYSHQDQVVALPAGARLLGRAPHCPKALFAVGDHLLGIQAHPEFGHEYLAALLQDRVDRLGEEATAAALATLASPTDTATVAGWLVAFLRDAIEGRTR